MPIKRAAYKALRSDKKKRLKNISVISRVKTLAKDLTDLLSSKDKGKIEKALRTFISQLDKAARKGIIRRRTASRKASRMSKRVSKSLK